MPKNQIDVKIVGKDETPAAFKSVVDGAKTSAAEIKGSFGIIGNAIESVKAHWQLALGVIAGGTMFKEVVSATVEWNDNIVQLSKRLGITTEEASGLAVALHHVGLETDDYTSIAQKMTKQLRTNEDAFTALGIKTKDANGNWRNTQDVLTDAVDRLNKMKEGTDRNIAAQTIFGARVGNLTAILRLNKDMLEESRKKAEEFHLVVGPDGAAKVRAYKDSLADVKLIGESLEVQLGTQLIPTLTKLGLELSKHGPEFSAGFGKGLKFVATAGLEGYAAVNALVQSVKFLDIVLATPIDGKYAATVKAAFLDMGDQVTKVNDSVLNSIIRIRGFGGEHAKESARPTGENAPDSTSLVEKHKEYLKQLHEEVDELEKGAKLGTLRISDMRHAIELQEKMLALATDPRASLLDRNAAADAAQRLQSAIPLSRAATIQQTPRAGPFDPKGKLANVTGGQFPPLVPPDIVKTAISFTDDLSDGFDKATERIFGTVDAVHTLGEDIGEIAATSIANFAGAWGDATKEIATGALGVGEAIGQSARKAVGVSADAKGSETLLDAGKAFAEGFHDPSQFLVAAKLFAIGTGYKALAGIMGGGGSGGGSGGGGGLSSGGFSQASAATQDLGSVTIVMKGSKMLIDAQDPSTQDEFIALIQQLVGNRQVNFVFGDQG